MTPLNLVMRTSDNLSSVLKGLPPVKGAMRTAVALCRDIVKGVNDSKRRDIDVQRAHQGNTAAQKASDEPLRARTHVDIAG